MQTHVFQVYIFCLTSCILLKISTEIEVLERINNKEAVIADVIKNISRVNDVLEDLIHNYEKLKKIYKSQETFEENYSSNKEEAEISKDNGEKRSKNKQLTTRKPGMLATQMFVSEEKNNPDTSESDDEENTVDKSRTPKIELYQEGEKYVKTTDIDQEKSLSSDSDYSEESEEEDDIIEIPDKYYPKIGTFNKELTAKTDNVLLNIGTTKVHTQRKYEKENNKTETSVHQHSIKINKMGPRNSNKTHSIKKTIEPEEIIKYAPVNLTKQSLTKRARTEFKFRTNATAKSALLDKKNNNDMHSYESIEDIKNLKKEQFKTRILRKAYGDACLKVVVKKCFKACKSALKSACVKYDCKSSFTSAFKDNAKTGCINQFREIPTNGTKLKAEVKLMHLTRNGYLGAACLPSPRTYSLQPIKARTNESKELNILRDRYERACQKTSSKKCKEACRYAIGETCKTYSCKKSKKYAFKKECKKECKKSYQYKKESSESDSSSKSDESGDSDSESKSLLKNDKKKKVTNVRKTRPQ